MIRIRTGPERQEAAVKLIYQYLDYDETHFSHKLHLSDDATRLTWQAAPKQNILLVRTPFGQNGAEYMRSFCRTDREHGFPEEGWKDMEPGVAFRYVTAMEKARNNGCELYGKACTYTIFSCCLIREDGQEICQVFAPLVRPMIPVSCNVVREVKVSVARRSVKNGVFHIFSRGTDSQSAYYEIRLSDPDEPYQDGDLVYTVGRWTYPIVEEMYRAGRFFVRSGIPPEVSSRNPGLSVSPQKP